MRSNAKVCVGWPTGLCSYERYSYRMSEISPTIELDPISAGCPISRINKIILFYKISNASEISPEWTGQPRMNRPLGE